MAKSNDKDLLEAFDSKENMEDYFDFEAATHPNYETRKVNVDMPIWMIEALDREAARLAINRQAVIKSLLDKELRRIA